MGSESTSWEHLVKEAWGRDWQPGLGAGGAETPGRWVIFCFLFFLFNSYLLGYVPWKASYDQPRQHIKKQRHYFANKVSSNQSYINIVVTYRCESWAMKKVEC